MRPEFKPLTVKSKIWIDDADSRVVFGTGRLLILEAVARSGSIHAAAQDLGMSYRGVWGKIKATEKRLGRPLLNRKTGGSRGGGSELTPFALELVERFSKLELLIRKSADEMFRDLFSPDFPD